MITRLRSLLFAPASRPDVLRKLPRSAPDGVVIDLEDIRLCVADTDLTPVDLGSYSSRVTLMAGNAAVQAAERARELIAEAVRYQLVTPWTGAVVLERAEQYDQFDLEQIDVASAPKLPTVPEPGVAMLSMVAVFMAIWPRRRGRG